MLVFILSEKRGVNRKIVWPIFRMVIIIIINTTVDTYYFISEDTIAKILLP